MVLFPAIFLFHGGKSKDKQCSLVCQFGNVNSQ